MWACNVASVRCRRGSGTTTRGGPVAARRISRRFPWLFFSLPTMPSAHSQSQIKDYGSACHLSAASVACSRGTSGGQHRSPKRHHLDLPAPRHVHVAGLSPPSRNRSGRSSGSLVHVASSRPISATSSSVRSGNACPARSPRCHSARRAAGGSAPASTGGGPRARRPSGALGPSESRVGDDVGGGGRISSPTQTPLPFRCRHGGPLPS